MIFFKVLQSSSLDNRHGNTVPCYGHGNCQCCIMIGTNVEEVNGLHIKPSPGNCKTSNTIYMVTCNLCNKSYIGRTTQPLSKRMSGHRECFYKVLRSHSDVDILSDEFSLGLHIFNEHGATDAMDFNDFYNVQIVENCNPASLDKKEHCYIHKYNTLSPIGLNKTNPFGLPILAT